MTRGEARRALVVGKFLPPHRGHHALIEKAQGLAGHVDVIVCDEPGQRPGADLRRAWLAQRHPQVSVHVVADICGWHLPAPCPPTCSLAWADHLHERGYGPWDLVVTSEQYGAGFAAALGADHIAFDRGRSTVRCSGTSIRHDLAAGWSCLDPIVRAGMIRKVVVVGAESTGTTTLAAALADELGAVSVPEFGRGATHRLAEEFGSVWDIEWTSDHFDEIATGQQRSEDDALVRLVGHPATFGRRGPWVVCDTDVLATSVWRERYLGRGSAVPVRGAGTAPRVSDLYVLTTPEGVAFEQDGIRDGEHLRDWMTGRFRRVLDATGVRWVEVVGPTPERLATVLEAIDSMPPPLCQASPTREDQSP